MGTARPAWKDGQRPHLPPLPIPSQEPQAMSTPTTPNTTETPVAADARKDSLIEYPSQFPIKVMGANVDGFVTAVTHVARQFDPGFDASTVQLRDSSSGNYLGVTITVTA